MTNDSGIAPLDKRILILADPIKDKTEGGVWLPDQERDKQKFAQTKATVIQIGDMAWAEAKFDAKQFSIAARFPEAGSRVLVGRYTGDVHKGLDGKDYTIINDTDIIGLLTE